MFGSAKQSSNDWIGSNKACYQLHKPIKNLDNGLQAILTILLIPMYALYTELYTVHEQVLLRQQAIQATYQAGECRYSKVVCNNVAERLVNHNPNLEQ